MINVPTSLPLRGVCRHDLTRRSPSYGKLKRKLKRSETD